MNAADTMEVSGIQCPFDGTGSTGLAGIRDPTSRKLQITGELKPCPVASRCATRS